MISNLHHRITLFVVLALVLLGSPSPASAQCLGPDGLTGPCCVVPVLPNLPVFPAVTLPSAAVCWSACAPTKTAILVTLGAPNPNGCTSFTAPLSVLDASGAPLQAGTATLDYTRGWEETNDDGDPLHVFRMLMKVDLGPMGAVVCPVPLCAAITPTAFFYGHVDFAFNCNSGSWETALSLVHTCDKFIHNSVASSIPAAIHPIDTYAIVGPDVAANPFVPSLIPPLTGPVTGGAIRNVAVPGTPCTFEEPIAAGAANLGAIVTACACPLNLAGPFQHTAQPFSGVSTCGSSFSAIQTPLPLPWLRMITTGLGAWTGSGPGTAYPGAETLWACEGFFFHIDGCITTASVDVDYGVMTAKGFLVTPNSLRPWLTEQMLDLASNYSKQQGINPPFVGSVKPTKHLIYVNF